MKRLPVFLPVVAAAIRLAVADAPGGAAIGADDDAASRFELGKRHYRGEGVEIDKEKAAGLIRAAAEGGLPEAQGWYGFLLSRGEGVARDEAAAIGWLEKAAGGGVASAQFNLGLLLVKGAGAPKDVARGVALVEKAASGGQVEARARLAEWCYFGAEGVAKDPARAFRWARQAGEGGHAWSQNLCGNMLEWGEGVALDRVEAMRWYRKAAEQGHAKAQASLGRLHASGLAGKRDVVEAYYWLWKSAEQNEWTGINFLKDMVPGMSEAERKEALRRIGVEPARGAP